MVEQNMDTPTPQAQYVERLKRFVNGVRLTLRETGETSGLNYAGYARGLGNKMIRVDISKSVVNTSTGENSKGEPFSNSYTVLCGTAKVARNDKTGFWYTQLSGSMPVFIAPRQDHRDRRNFFQQLAESHLNQHRQKSLIALKLKGSADVSAHSIAVARIPEADGTFREVLVIEADAIYSGRKSWSVMDLPYSDAINEVIESARKPANEGSPETADTPASDPEMADALAG